MKKTSTILAISSLLSFSISSGAIASPPVTAIQLSQRGDRCDDALASVERKIQENRDIPVRFEAREIPDDYWQEGGPPDGQKIMQVQMGGPMGGNYQHVSNVMNSPQLQNALATEIINACSDISGISIGVFGTDWMGFYGLIGDKVEPFQCTPLPRGGRGPVPGSPAMTWGFVYC